jgi:DNA-binding IclR family transcriptional regulator
MPEKPIPDEARRLIAGHIRTVEQLEILLLLNGSPGKGFSIADVFRVIQSSENSVATSLKAFVSAGFLVEESKGMYRHEPANAELARSIEALAKTYQERRVSVIEAIYSQASDPLRNFADAFKLRKEK